MMLIMIDPGGIHRLAPRQEVAALADAAGINTPRVSYNI